MENNDSDSQYTPDDKSIGKFRRWFRAAVDNATEWRDEAKEDYEFVAGKQWSDSERTHSRHKAGQRLQSIASSPSSMFFPAISG